MKSETVISEPFEAEKLHEECGVFGIYSDTENDVARSVYYGLYALQHRGQESCGIAVNNKGTFRYHKDVGLVNDVFDSDTLDELGTGSMAVGHVRYGTTGASSRLNAQPITISHMKGRLSTVHNGNLTNAAELRRELELNGAIFHTTSDTEIISYVITDERLKYDSEEDAVVAAMGKIQGAYSLILMFEKKLIALRDPHGFRPLCYGLTPDGNYIIASESCALDATGAKFIRDIKPGEVVIFDESGVHTREDRINSAREAMCIFEYIYFARPDSVIDGFSVHRARLRAGEFLCYQHPVDADVVIGVPDSGTDAAIGFSNKSGIPYGLGFIKNKYIGRTFIAPGQSSREDKVRIKLSPIAETVKGKRVVMVDDSIVRGTTMARTVNLLRDAGATEVHVRVTAPPFRFPCYFGVDIDTQENLIACKHTVDEIREIIGADSLGFLEIEALPCLVGDETCHEYCTGCFTGDYHAPTPAISSKDKLEV